MVHVTLYKKNTEDLKIVSLTSFIFKKQNTFISNVFVVDNKKISNSNMDITGSVLNTIELETNKEQRNKQPPPQKKETVHRTI